MTSHNITANENARELRAEEMQHIHHIVAARLSAYGPLLVAAALSVLAAISESLRPLFSWNPRAN